MPLAGYVCPPGTPTAGTQNSLEHCITTCPHPCVTAPLLVAMFKAEESNHHQGDYLSASMLCGTDCARRTVYERCHPFYEVPTKRYWPFRGTHAHTIIEGAADYLTGYGWLQELRMLVLLEYDMAAPIFDDGIFTGHYDESQSLIIPLGGTLDAYNYRRSEMIDFKSMADVKAQMFAKGSHGGTYSPYFEDRWVMQLNIYAWLLAHTRVPPEIQNELNNVEFFPAPTSLVIQGIAMMSIPRSGASIEMKVGKWDKELFEIPPIPVLPLDTVEAYIRDRALPWYRYLRLGEQAPVVEKSMSWLCKFCAFNGELIPGERCLPTQERKALESTS